MQLPKGNRPLTALGLIAGALIVTLAVAGRNEAPNKLRGNFQEPLPSEPTSAYPITMRRVPNSPDAEWIDLAIADTQQYLNLETALHTPNTLIIEKYSSDEDGGWELRGIFLAEAANDDTVFMLYQRTNLRWDYQHSSLYFDNELNLKGSYLEFFVLAVTIVNKDAVRILDRFEIFPTEHGKSPIRSDISATMHLRDQLVEVRLEAGGQLLTTKTIPTE